MRHGFADQEVFQSVELHGVTENEKGEKCVDIHLELVGLATAADLEDLISELTRLAKGLQEEPHPALT